MDLSQRRGGLIPSTSRGLLANSKPIWKAASASVSSRREVSRLWGGSARHGKESCLLDVGRKSLFREKESLLTSEVLIPSTME